MNENMDEAINHKIQIDQDDMQEEVDYCNSAIVCFFWVLIHLMW